MIPRILLLTHPGLADGLLEAAAAILKVRPDVDRMSPDGDAPLDDRVRGWLDAAPGPALILTDLGFGSCCASARRVAEGRPDVRIVAGVSLPILLAALRSREHEDLDALVQHLARRGAESVETFGGAE